MRLANSAIAAFRELVRVWVRSLNYANIIKASVNFFHSLARLGAQNFHTARKREAGSVSGNSACRVKGGRGFGGNRPEIARILVLSARNWACVGLWYGYCSKFGSIGFLCLKE